MDIKVTIPKERIVMKTIAAAVGSFEIPTIKLGDKDIRLTMAKDHRLPDGTIEGNLYGRKYKTARGEFTEIAIYVTNSVAK